MAFCLEIYFAVMIHVFLIKHICTMLVVCCCVMDSATAFKRNVYGFESLRAGYLSVVYFMRAHSALGVKFLWLTCHRT